MHHLQPISGGYDFSFSHHILREEFNQPFLSGTHHIHGIECRVRPTQRESTVQRLGFLLAAISTVSFPPKVKENHGTSYWFANNWPSSSLSTYNLLLFAVESVPMPEVLSVKRVNGDSEDFYVRASAVAFKRR